MKISRLDWTKTVARLKITNDTGIIWLNPTINYTFGQNWGDHINKTMTLPSLATGESADFLIPFDFQLSDRENTSAYIQIYLGGDENYLDEHYWGVWFDILD